MLARAPRSWPLVGQVSLWQRIYWYAVCSIALFETFGRYGSRPFGDLFYVVWQPRSAISLGGNPLQFVGIVGLTFCLIAALAALRLAKESDSPWPTIFVLGLGALVLAGIVYYGPYEWPF